MESDFPFLLIDLEQCNENINRMLLKAQASKTRLRPHFKTHQSAGIGKLFKAKGISSITVSSVPMASHFFKHGWEDITIAFPLNPLEAHSYNNLAQKGRLKLLASDLYAFKSLLSKIAEPIGLFIEIDNGYHRSGLEPHSPDILKIIELSRQNPLIQFEGFLSHEGNTYNATHSTQIRDIHLKAKENMLELKEKFIREFPALIISMGDTPSCSIMEGFEGIDEIRPGNFVFYDLMQLSIQACQYHEISMAMICPVVAVYPQRRQLIIHSGAVHLSKEHIRENEKNIYGKVAAFNGQKWGNMLEGFQVVSLSQEHGIIQWDENQTNPFKPGQFIAVLPVHACLAADLMKSFISIGGENMLI